MKHVRKVLEEADPLRIEPELSGDDAQRMRQVILGSARGTHAAHAFWPRALAVAAVLVLMAVAGAFTALRGPARDAGVAETASAQPLDASERLQLQFATPGGTRVIWTLDPHFKMQEVPR